MTDSRSSGVHTRRHFIHSLACGAAALAFTRPSLAGYAQRSVAFVHTHTGEVLNATYFRNGLYQPSALARVAFVLRDFRSGDVHQIDPLLLDALFELQILHRHDKPYEVISGYRSPATNAKLRSNSTGVAKHSLHMQGQAIDIRVPGVSTKKLRDLAISLGRGGVGYYPGSAFVHVDTGRLRTWQG